MAPLRPDPSAVVSAVLQRLPTLRGRLTSRRARRDHELALRHVPAGGAEVARPDVLVAAVLTPGTARTFAPEWQQRLLEPHNWRRDLDETAQLLLVQSSVPRLTQDWCTELARRSHQLGVPSVLWVDEPVPVSPATVAAAAGFDHVLWADPWAGSQLADRLGESGGGVLAPAVQPRVDHAIGRPVGTQTTSLGHHGLTRAQRRQLQRALPLTVRLRPFDVARTDPAPVGPGWPDVLLDLAAADEATELTPVPVLQVAARQIPVVSDRVAVRALLAPDAPGRIPAQEDPQAAELVVDLPSASESALHARALATQPELRERRGLAAARAVLSSHTASHRVDQLLALTGVDSEPLATPAPVTVVVPTMRPGRLADVFEFVGRQTHRPVQLVLATHGFSPDPADLARLAEEHGVEEYRLVPLTADRTLGACLNAGVAVADAELVAKMDDDNHYGKHYLTDLVLASAGASAEVVGKGAHYVHLMASGATIRRFPELEHRYARFVQGGTLLTTRETLREVPFADLPRGVDTAFLAGVRRAGGRIYSADRFNFVSFRRSSTPHTWPVGDYELLGRGGALETFGNSVAHATA